MHSTGQLYSKFDIDHIINGMKENIPVMISNNLFCEAFNNEKDNPGCFGFVPLLHRIAKQQKWNADISDIKSIIIYIFKLRIAIMF